MESKLRRLIHGGKWVNNLSDLQPVVDHSQLLFYISRVPTSSLTYSLGVRLLIQPAIIIRIFALSCPGSDVINAKM